VKLGLRLPQRLGVDLQHDLVEAARTAEAAGYASLWTYERLLFPKTPVEPYAELPNVPQPEDIGARLTLRGSRLACGWRVRHGDDRDRGCNGDH
jgi:alkanesulfonate monooxygenase SsuD/methylene tetrahydromethanopterin reductase-like flavin-dependent oxidoreductase (luciferase family)